MDVSILICTYGEDRWRRLAIERALPSAQAQKDAHEVRAWHSPEHTLTLAETRNLAAREASGGWLCFLDADDELAPGYVAAMRERAAEMGAGAALLYPAVQYVTGKSESRPALLGQGRPLIELNRAVIGSLIPRQLFLSLGGFGEEPIYEDWALWLRASRHVALMAVPKAVYRVHQAPSGRNKARLGREWYAKIRAEAQAA